MCFDCHRGSGLEGPFLALTCVFLSFFPFFCSLTAVCNGNEFRPAQKETEESVPEKEEK